MAAGFLLLLGFFFTLLSFCLQTNVLYLLIFFLQINLRGESMIADLINDRRFNYVNLVVITHLLQHDVDQNCDNTVHSELSQESCS